jgi:hypothetical protein
VIGCKVPGCGLQGALLLHDPLLHLLPSVVPPDHTTTSHWSLLAMSAACLSGLWVMVNFTAGAVQVEMVHMRRHHVSCTAQVRRLLHLYVPVEAHAWARHCSTM